MNIYKLNTINKLEEKKLMGLRQIIFSKYVKHYDISVIDLLLE